MRYLGGPAQNGRQISIQARDVIGGLEYLISWPAVLVGVQKPRNQVGNGNSAGARPGFVVCDDAVIRSCARECFGMTAEE